MKSFWLLLNKPLTAFNLRLVDGAADNEAAFASLKKLFTLSTCSSALFIGSTGGVGPATNCAKGLGLLIMLGISKCIWPSIWYTASSQFQASRFTTDDVPLIRPPCGTTL